MHQKVIDKLKELGFVYVGSSSYKKDDKRYMVLTDEVYPYHKKQWLGIHYPCDVFYGMLLNELRKIKLEKICRSI